MIVCDSGQETGDKVTLKFNAFTILSIMFSGQKDRKKQQQKSVQRGGEKTSKKNAKSTRNGGVATPMSIDDDFAADAGSPAASSPRLYNFTYSSI